MAASLTIKALNLYRGSEHLLTLDETIKGGEILTIMGPSGSGKSTLLNWLSGMLPKGFSAQGALYFNQQDISHQPSHLRHLGLLYQDSLLFSHLDVAGNIAFAMPKGDKQQRLKKITEALSQVGLSGIEQRSVSSLSGGQQARVALLRVLLSQPKAILLDEPFSKLDSQLRSEIRELVFSQIHALKVPAILVTHDYSDASAAAGKVINITKESEHA